MKKNVFILFAFLAFLSASAQIIKPVKWTSRLQKISDTEFNLIMDGTIDEGWHVYSQFTPDGGSLPMEIKYKDQKGNYELIGKTAESKTKRAFSDVFEVDEIMFEKKVVLTQKVRITGKNVTKINVNVAYQVCKQSCINDDKDFTFDIPKITAKETAVTPAIPAVKIDTVVVDTPKPDTVKSNGIAKTQVKQVAAPKKKKKRKAFSASFSLHF
ncbi:protein-disulfide reductase DsbD domain-containing protein [Flavobacterium sp. 3HN19-14]|uniref:protein-disulfide reductase DsbD domain-containing protein n=1 Tax=Flavobacterium sp. 3HN19-14 TaxID=3448133 RepID=UPI003EE03660